MPIGGIFNRNSTHSHRDGCSCASYNDGVSPRRATLSHAERTAASRALPVGGLRGSAPQSRRSQRKPRREAAASGACWSNAPLRTRGARGAAGCVRRCGRKTGSHGRFTPRSVSRRWAGFRATTRIRPTTRSSWSALWGNESAAALLPCLSILCCAIFISQLHFAAVYCAPVCDDEDDAVRHRCLAETEPSAERFRDGARQFPSELRLERGVLVLPSVPVGAVERCARRMPSRAAGSSRHRAKRVDVWFVRCPRRPRLRRAGRR